MKLVATFELSDEYVEHLKRCKKELKFEEKLLLDEVIYAYQIGDFKNITALTVDSPVSDWPVCYKTKKQ